MHLAAAGLCSSGATSMRLRCGLLSQPAQPERRTNMQVEWSTTISEIPVALAWSDDGRWLAAGGADGEVFVVDAVGLCEVTRFAAHTNGLFQLAWQPSGNRLLTSGQDGCARVWDLSDNDARPVGEVRFAQDWVEHCGWQPSGKSFAAAAGRDVKVLDADGALQRDYRFESSTVAALAWRPQGAQLAAAGYQGVMLFSPLDARQPPKALPWNGSMVSMAWRPDGSVIACGCQDSSVHFWRLREGTEAYMSGYETKPRHLVWSRDGEWLATSGGSDVTLWRFRKSSPEGTSPTNLRRHRAPLQALAFAPRGRRLISGCAGGWVCLWDQFEDFTPPTEALQFSAGIEALAWQPRATGGMFAVGDAAGTVQLLVTAK